MVMQNSLRSQQSIRAAQNFYRLLKTVDMYATVSGNYYVFPNGARSSSLPSVNLPKEVNQLSETTFGMTFAYGKVIFSQSLSLGLRQVGNVSDPQNQLQRYSGFLSSSLGYVAHEILPENTNLRVRFAPAVELGFGTITLPNNFSNSYTTVGPALDVSCVIPLTEKYTDPDTHAFSTLACYVSVRSAYNWHLSRLNFESLHGVFVTRATVGIGLHSGIDPNFADAEY
ncbi:MAG: hypothetical protein EAZ92_06190 [Candidatus Kapaibacterium sp.]|nr:MAG: hypothetical protein EAZ92_06190 [Candidatus Kapabacteria bacterium]